MKPGMFTHLIVAMTLAAGAAMSQENKASFPGIEQLMTSEEYRATGLDKLSPAEREALNKWLIRYTAEDSQVLVNTDREVKQAVQEQETVSVILPPFQGWSGKTVFKLQNGQVWQQRRAGSYAYTGSNPEVRITRNFMGFHSMEMVENGNAVLVKRLK